MDKYEHLDALYRQYMKSLYYYLYKMCGNAEPAEDLVQETFVRAIIHLHEADALHAKVWLYQVARNTYLDEWRKAERRWKKPLFQLFLKPRDMYSPYGLPEQEVIEKESVATVQSLLAQLSENYRTVITGPTKELLKLRGEPGVYDVQLGDVELWNWE